MKVAIVFISRTQSRAMVGDYHDHPISTERKGVLTSISRRTGRFRLAVAKNLPDPPLRAIKYFFPLENCASDPADPPCDPPDVPFSGLSVGAVNWFTSGVNLIEDLPINGSENHDLGLLAGLNLTNIDLGSWHILFDFDDSDLACTDSSHLTVTHADINTWTIEADKDAVACLKLLDSGGGGGGVPRGLFYMPFKIVLERKQPE
jgi:hypothetical protein